MREGGGVKHCMFDNGNLTKGGQQPPSASLDEPPVSIRASHVHQKQTLPGASAVNLPPLSQEVGGILEDSDDHFGLIRSILLHIQVQNTAQQLREHCHERGQMREMQRLVVRTSVAIQGTSRGPLSQASWLPTIQLHYPVLLP